MFDEYRHFLLKTHKYRTTEKHIFNRKEETGLKPQRMTSHLYRLEYNRIIKVHKCICILYLMFGIFIFISFCLSYLKIIVVIFVMLHEGFQSINGIPQGLKSYPIQFSRFPYNYEHLQIPHLFDTMHIGKNVT